MPVVSIIIPVYRSEKVLETAVTSVLQQSLTDFEILLIDDGSPDNSLELCHKLAKNDSRIKVYHKENGGICSARNYGIMQATGKYIAFLDHDDEYLNDYLKDNIALLELYQADAVKFERLREYHYASGNVKLFHGNRIQKMPNIKEKVACYRGEEISSFFPAIRQAVKIMYIWDGIYNREFLQKHNIFFDESFKFGHEDIMFNLDVLTYIETMVFNAKEYYKHKFREETSTSAIFNPARIKDAIKTALKEGALLSSWNYPEEEILQSYMNELFRVLHILYLPSNDCSTKVRIYYLNIFRKNTFCTLNYYPTSVKKLISKNPLHGILAFFFYHKNYSICILLFKVYRFLQSFK